MDATTGRPSIMPPAPIPSFPAAETAAAADLQQCCRFCLRFAAEPHRMRQLPATAHQMRRTDIPQLFETVTALPLDLGAGYSALLCGECELRMRTVAQTRADFLRTVQVWQRALYGMRTDAKLEREAGPSADYDAADAALIEAKAEVQCDLLLAADDVKLEHEDRDGRPSDDRDDTDDEATTAVAPQKRREKRRRRKSYDSHDDNVNWTDDGDDEVAPKSKRGRRPAFGKPPHGEPLMCDICMAILTTR